MNKSEPLPLSEQDMKDLKSLADEQPAPDPQAEEAPFVPILKVWQVICDSAAAEATKRISPIWAVQVSGQYKQLTIQEMPRLRDIYFDLIAQMGQVIADEIATDEECLKVETAEEDAANNGMHLLNVITDWQLNVLRWELEWDCADPEAHIVIAAIGECHKMFLSDKGIINYVDTIGWRMTDAQQDEMAATLRAVTEEL